MLALDLLQYIPADLRYERTPLDDGKNALGPWLAAVDLFQPLESESENISKLLYGWCDGDAPPSPTDEEWKTIDKWIDANREAMVRLDEGISCGSLQLPLSEGREAVFSPRKLTGMEIFGPARLIRIRSSRAAAREDTAAAVDDAARMLQIARMILNGEGLWVDALIGFAVLRSGAASVLKATQSGRLSEQQLLRLSELLDACPEVNAAADVTERIELCIYALPTLSMLHEHAPLEEIVNSMLTLFYDDGSSLRYMAEVTGEEPIAEKILQRRLDARRRQLLTLLANHPQLLDHVATVRAMVDLVRDRRQAQADGRDAPGGANRILGALRRRVRPTSDELFDRAWPDILRSSFPLECFGDDGLAAASRAEVRELMADSFPKWKPRMLNERELLRCRKLLRRIDNPVGLVAAQQLIGIGVPKQLRDDVGREISEARDALNRYAECESPIS